MSLNRGEEVHGEVSSTNASSGVPVPFVSPIGDTRVIAAGEQVLITDVNLISVAGGTISLAAQGAAFTLTMFGGVVPANTVVSRHWNTPFLLPAGGTLTLTATSGRVDVQVEGAVIH